MPATRLSKRLPWVSTPGVVGVTPTTLTLQVCSYNALTDVPTVVFDLNDKTTTFVHAQSFKMPQPDKTWVRSGNIRTPGEKISKFQYRNRHLQASIWIRGNSTNAIQNSVHALIAAIEQPPYVLKVALPGSTTVSYADVVAVKHNVPPDPVVILGGAQTHIELDFECRPGLRGNRITLSNLVTNPGFEAPSGPAVTVFNDTLATINAYSVQASSAPTLGASIMTIPNGTRIAFGSPAWGAINTWQIRWQWLTGLTANFNLHYTDANNLLAVTVTGTALNIFHTIAGTAHNQAGSAIALTNSNVYWLKITQFPSVPGNPPYLTATLFNDSAGAVGTQVASVSAAAFDAVTALSGWPQISASGAALNMGGAFGGVHNVSLFGPGGWIFDGGYNGVGTTRASGAWEQNTANTYPNGPVTSFGAARIEAPPAGTWAAAWRTYTGGAPAGTAAMPVQAPLDTIRVSGQAKSNGLSGSGVVQAILNEYDASGNFLRQTTTTLTLSVGLYTPFNVTVTTGASTAYVGLDLVAGDTSAPGASANATVWFDNVQVWDQTTTGAASMPYCELRFPQSPAQLLVSGLVGDMETPALAAFAAFSTSWAPGTTFSFAVGRRAQASANAQLVVADVTNQALGPVKTVLDSGSYGGYYINGNNGYEDFPFSPRAADMLGVYHVFSRYMSGQSGGALATITVGVEAFQQKVPYYSPNAADYLWHYAGPTTNPLTAGSVWTVTDAGQLTIPLVAGGATTDLTQGYVTIGATWGDNNPPQPSRLNWMFLLPIDGALLMGTLINPTLTGVTPTNSWLWIYVDGLGIDQGQAANSGYSIETRVLANPGSSRGGPGALSGTYVSINNTVDPYLTLDPTVPGAINQLGALLRDNTGTVLPFHTEIQYAPLYLTLR